MMKLLSILLLSLAFSAPSFAAERDNLKLTKHVHGATLTEAAKSAKILVVHQWQEHCPQCPKSLKAFQRTAKKYSKFQFLIWHSDDPFEKAQAKAKKLKLKLPVYHGQFLGNKGWPSVKIYDKNGKLIFDGATGKAFEKKLKELKKAAK